jgi:hypothetical protein
MCSNETNIYRLRRKQNQNHQAIVIAFDIEHKPLIANSIYAVKRFLNISETSVNVPVPVSLG